VHVAYSDALGWQGAADRSRIGMRRTRWARRRRFRQGRWNSA
jgi:hypothetical protein